MVSEVRTTSSTGGEKGVKAERHGLIPVEALSIVAQLYGKGAEKYEAHNWRRGYEWSKSYDALQRHANAFWNGEDLDPEMQLPHMASVVFHALTLITFMKEQPGFDDRFKPEEDVKIAMLREKLMDNSGDQLYEEAIVALNHVATTTYLDASSQDLQGL